MNTTSACANPAASRRARIAVAAAVEPCACVVLVSTSSLKIARASARSASGGIGPGVPANAIAAVPQITKHSITFRYISATRSLSDDDQLVPTKTSKLFFAAHSIMGASEVRWCSRAANACLLGMPGTLPGLYRITGNGPGTVGLYTGLYRVRSPETNETVLTAS